MALDFESTLSNWVDLGTNFPTLQNVGGATVSAWARAESAPGTFGDILACSIGTSPTTSRLVLFQNSTPNWNIVGRCTDAGAFGIVSGGAVSMGTLVHLAATLDYLGSLLSIYVDGAFVASVSPAWGTNSSNTASQAAAIGSNDDGSGSEFFDGVEQDVRLYDRVLSATEIEIIANSYGRDSIVDGLVNRWLLNEGAPGAAASGAGSVRDIGVGTWPGTPTNSPTYSEHLVSTRRRPA